MLNLRTVQVTMHQYGDTLGLASTREFTLHVADESLADLKMCLDALEGDVSYQVVP